MDTLRSPCEGTVIIGRGLPRSSPGRCIRAERLCARSGHRPRAAGGPKERSPLVESALALHALMEAVCRPNQARRTRRVSSRATRWSASSARGRWGSSTWAATRSSAGSSRSRRSGPPPRTTRSSGSSTSGSCARRRPPGSSRTRTSSRFTTSARRSRPRRPSSRWSTSRERTSSSSWRRRTSFSWDRIAEIAGRSPRRSTTRTAAGSSTATSSPRTSSSRPTEP